MRQKIELARPGVGGHPRAGGRHGPARRGRPRAKPLDSFVARLAAGRLFMHKKEYVLSESRRAGNRKLWNELRRLPPGVFPKGRARTMRCGTRACWPSRPRIARSSIVRSSSTIASAPPGVRHFATEQLVEGVILGRTGRLEPAQEWFTHYWGNKRGYDAEISRRLADAFIEGQSVKDAAAHYRRRPIDLPAEVRPSRGQKFVDWIDRHR
jgi:hypothetical protein